MDRLCARRNVVQIARNNPNYHTTGRYHRQLHQCLAAAGVETVAVRPDCARRFAEALGLLAKTDRVDAKVLARYGRLEGLEATAPLDQALADLQDLVRVRRRCVDEIAALGRLDQELGAKPALRHLRKLRAALEREVKAVDKNLLAAIEADAGLLAAMPELGSLGSRAAGALLGVAPCARDSGSHEGRRHVRGGRAQPRCVVYMAALAAIRCNPPLAAFYKRLRDRGKQAKVALVAVMRKLVSLADALLRADRLWQSSAPPSEVPA